ENHRRAVDHRSLGESLIAVVRLTQILETFAMLVRVDRAPFRGGTERVQVLMDEHLAERVRRVVRVDERTLSPELALRFVERGDDLIVHALLPVAGRVAGRRRGGALKSALQQQCGEAECGEGEEHESIVIRSDSATHWPRASFA